MRSNEQETSVKPRKYGLAIHLNACLYEVKLIVLGALMIANRVLFVFVCVVIGVGAFFFIQDGFNNAAVVCDRGPDSGIGYLACFSKNSSEQLLLIALLLSIPLFRLYNIKRAKGLEVFTGSQGNSNQKPSKAEEGAERPKMYSLLELRRMELQSLVKSAAVEVSAGNVVETDRSQMSGTFRVIVGELYEIYRVYDLIASNLGSVEQAEEVDAVKVVQSLGYKTGTSTDSDELKTLPNLSSLDTYPLQSLETDENLVNRAIRALDTQYREHYKMVSSSLWLCSIGKGSADVIKVVNWLKEGLIIYMSSLQFIDGGKSELPEAIESANSDQIVKDALAYSNTSS